MSDLSGLAHVTVNERRLGQVSVAVELGELCVASLGNGECPEERMPLWAANGVRSLGTDRVVVVFEGGTVVTLLVPEEHLSAWLAAIVPWIPAEDATKNLLGNLVRALRKNAASQGTDAADTSDDAPAVVLDRSTKTQLGTRSLLKYAGNTEELLSHVLHLEKRLDVLATELASTKEAVETAEFLFQSADAERSQLKAQLDAVNDAVRLKAIGMLMSRNADMANLKLQVDMYQEQIEYLVNDNERLKSQGKALIAAKQHVIASLVSVISEIRAEAHKYRCLLYRSSADERGLDVEALFSKMEHVRRSLFFSMCAHLRLARTLSSDQGVPVPDASKLYEQYGALAEDQWRHRLCEVFGVKVELLGTASSANEI